MNSYIFDKQIKVDEVPDRVMNVKLEDGYDYITLVNGLHVVGAITISGEYLANAHQVPFKDTLNIDVIIPNENILNMRDLRFSVENYEVHIVDNFLNFKIKCQINGHDLTKEEKEVEANIQEVVENLDPNAPNSLLDQFRDNLSEEDEKTLEALIKGEKVDIIATESVEEHETIESDPISEQMPEDPETEHPFVDDLAEITPLETEESNNKQVIEDKIKEIKNQSSPNPNALFKEERFVIFSRFYRVRRGDTYESIASTNNVDIDQLKSLNKYKEISEGSLVQIPR